MKTRKIRDDAWLALFAILLYLAVGIWFNSQDLIFPDSMSRVANGYYVIFSRDPHLGAVGFVWNPLPSLLAIPLLLLSPLFPVLASKAFAGVIISVLAGALTVVLMRRLMLEMGLSRGWSLVLTGLFAIQPLVLMSAATGASEALLLAASTYVTLAITRWIQRDEPWRLVQAGVGLGVGYLVRYEAAPAALAVSILVLGMSLWRSRGGRRPWTTALVEWFLVASPFALTFLGWALISRVVVGDWFATYASQYGNTAQVNTGRTDIDYYTGGTAEGVLSYMSSQLVLVGPMLVPLLVIAAALALRTRDLRLLGPATVMGAILVFDWVVFFNGTSYGWLRFQIMAIPWSYVLAAFMLGTDGTRVSHGAKRATTWVVMGAMVATLPLAWRASLDPRLAREEAEAVASAEGGQLAAQAAMASYLDGLDLPEGSVMTDVAYSFGVVLASRHPRQFIITPDRDFYEKLADPVAEDVKYALVTNPDRSSADAVAGAYPSMFDDGAGIASLKMEYTDGRGQAWRLYEFTDDRQG